MIVGFWSLVLVGKSPGLDAEVSLSIEAGEVPNAKEDINASSVGSRRFLLISLSVVSDDSAETLSAGPDGF